MKIQQSRNQREGRYAKKHYGSHRRNKPNEWGEMVGPYPRNDRDCYMNRSQRKRDKMRPYEDDGDLSYLPFF